MFTNNLISILRNFWKSKTTTFINLVGLTLGLTVAIILIILVKHENSFDTFHKNSNTLYRVLSVRQEPGSNIRKYFSFSPSALGENLKANFPELKNNVSLTATGPKMRIGEILYDEETLYVDNNFLKIFSFRMIKGNSENALNEPTSVVLTNSFAKKIFGNQDPFNNMITINKKAYKVAGIVEDTPANSSLQFSALFPISSYQIYNQIIDDWGNNLTYVYINLPINMSNESAEYMINQFTKTYKAEGTISVFALHSILRMHLFSNSDYGGIKPESKTKGNITNLIIYTFFVFFILLTAIINFTNISFNQIYRKTNEIGMRRILGASKMQIFIRSWLESFIICIASFIFCLLVVSLILPEFNSLINRRIEFSSILGSLGEIGTVLFVVSLLLGILPAMKLTTQSNPQTLRRGINFSNSYKSVKGMLVVQFAIALFFLITTILISKQMSFINSKYNINEDEDIIQVRNSRNEKTTDVQSKLFFENVAKSNLIKTSTFSQGIGVRNATYLDEFALNGKKELCSIYKIEKEHFSMYNYKIKMGRSFDDKAFPSDTSDAIIVNESFLQKFGIKNPLNTIVTGSTKNYKIVGVVEDYASYTLKQKIEPLVLLPVKKITDFSFKVSKQNELAALGLIKKEWKRYYPDEVLSYTFYNETVLKEYRDELISHKLFRILSIASISLSLLGVVGLSSLMLVKRKKEIAIRKILGASIQNLIFHFSKEFSIVIGIGFLIACAFSYNYVKNFLDDFVYKIRIDSIPFITSLVMIMLIVFTTISIQSLKVLYANPVESLKNE